MNNKLMFQGMLGGLCQEGVFIDGYKEDELGLTFYITIPEDSYRYHEENTIRNSPESFAKRIKETFKMMMGDNVRIKYKTHNIYWTKELGKKYYEKNQNKILNLEFPVLFDKED